MNKIIFKATYLSFLSKVVLRKIYFNAQEMFRKLETKLKKAIKLKVDIKFVYYYYYYYCQFFNLNK